MNQKVHGSLDELKEGLFKLELRRQATHLRSPKATTHASTLACKAPPAIWSKAERRALSANGTHSTSIPRSCGIRFDKVEKRFGSLIALRGVSLEIAPGEFVALLGHNGAGKTTLLRIAALLMDPTTGAVSFTGVSPSNGDAASAQHRRLVGMVAHSTLLYDELTARKRIFGCSANSMGSSHSRAKVADALAACGLASRAGSLVRTFSRGMRQRLAISRALLHGPRLILLDEPAAGLDRQGIQWFGATLVRLRRDGCTIIMSTLARNESLVLATRAISLRAGRVEHDSGPGGDPRPLLAALRAEA